LLAAHPQKAAIANNSCNPIPARLTGTRPIGP
jgi:hypothetical protein